MAKENKTKYAILGVLNLKPASGYDIKKFCDESIAHFWNENYGHIYPVLNQLEEEALVEKTTEVNQGKLRNVYTITALGKEKLVEWLGLPPEVPQARYEFLLKLFFSKEIPVQSVIEQLDRSKVFCGTLLRQYEKIADHLKSAIESNYQEREEVAYWYVTVRYGILNMDANIQWCEESIALLRSLSNE